MINRGLILSGSLIVAVLSFTSQFSEAAPPDSAVHFLQPFPRNRPLQASTWISLSATDDKIVVNEEILDSVNANAWAQAAKIETTEKTRVVQTLIEIAQNFEAPTTSVEGNESTAALQILSDRLRIEIRGGKLLGIYFVEGHRDSTFRSEQQKGVRGITHIFTAKEFKTRIKRMRRAREGRRLSILFLTREAFRHPDEDALGFLSEQIAETTRARGVPSNARLDQKTKDLGQWNKTIYDLPPYAYDSAPSRIVKYGVEILGEESPDWDDFQYEDMPSDTYMKQGRGRQCIESLTRRDGSSEMDSD